MNPRSSIRAFLRRVQAAILVVGALIAFWLLSNGMKGGTGAIVGYAEERVHAIGPVHTGPLREILVSLGQEVKPGDVLARLDTRLIELERDKLRAELDQAKAAITAERDRETAQLQRGQVVAVRQYVTAERARAELREVELQVKRLTQLRAQNLVRADELEEARRRQRALMAELASRPTGSSAELQALGLRPTTATTQQGRLEDRMAPLHAALKVKEAMLRQIEYTIDSMSLRAPVAGRVGAILVQPGTIVAEGTPVLNLTTARAGHVVAYVPERQLASVALGAAVRLRRPTFNTKFLFGHVVELAPQVEEAPIRARPSPAVPVWARRIVIKLDEPAALVPGEAFRVSPR